MQSFRDQLNKISAIENAKAGYRSFFVQPASLSQAMSLMNLPGTFEQRTEKPIHEFWTEQCQGVIWDGKHWLFSSNGSQPVNGTVLGDSPKAIYTFNGNTKFLMSECIHQYIIAAPTSSLHVGALFYFNGNVYVDTFVNNVDAQILVFNNNDGELTLSHIINLDKVSGLRVSLCAINPFDSTLITAFGDGAIDQLFCHTMDGRLIASRSLKLLPSINDGRWIQGGVITDHGHIYVSSGRDNHTSDNQYIYCYSLINGKQLQVIPVLAEAAKQELEGICYAPLIRNGAVVQLHAVLLDEHLLSKDGIFFKSFGSSDPTFN